MTPSIEARLEQLEHIEALKQLKYRYCAAVDANYDAKALAAMFTEDGVWDGAELGYFEGRQAIYDCFLDPNANVSWMTHTVLNPIIEISGKEARCQWYMWLPKILIDGATRSFQGGTHQDHCVLQNGQWLFKYMKVRLHRLPAQG